MEPILRWIATNTGADVYNARFGVGTAGAYGSSMFGEDCEYLSPSRPMETPMPEEISKTGRDERIKREEAALAKHGFATNDLVRIPGRHLAKINGRFVKLGDHAFTVLVLLAEQAIKSTGEYVSTEALIVAIKRGYRRLGALEMSWVEPTGEGVHRAVCQIRVALKKAGLDDSLLELVRGQGYRLNTPAFNILIDPAMGISGRPGEDAGTFGGNLLE
jgi:hypothetical protein